MKIITRKEAKQQGVVRYYTGRPCKRGHMDQRVTGNGNCCACARESGRRRYHDPLSGLAEKQKAKVRSAKFKAYSSEYSKKNRERIRLRDRERGISPQRAAYFKKYNEEHKGDKAARTRKRRGQLKQATVFSHERNEINEFYRNCPKDYVVDHIVPLQHPEVCGLHCIANFQYLTQKENLEKSNHFDSE